MLPIVHSSREYPEAGRHGSGRVKPVPYETGSKQPFTYVSRRGRSWSRLLGNRAVRALFALAAALYAYAAFSIAQALIAAGGAPVSAVLSGWARDHCLGWW